MENQNTLILSNETEIVGVNLLEYNQDLLKFTIPAITLGFSEISDLLSNKTNLAKITFKSGIVITDVFNNYTKVQSLTYDYANDQYIVFLAAANAQEVLLMLQEQLASMNAEPDISTLTLEEYRELRQSENKKALGTFLRENPILWMDGEYYGVTQEDQVEMISDKTAYDVKQASGYTNWKLEWHNVSKACREFTVEEFGGLLNAIIDFVYPYRRLQEQYKEQIFLCETKEQLSRLEFLYEIE